MDTETAAKSGQKLRGRPFQKGRSGNPLGRPQGCRNKASILLGELIDGEGNAIVKAMIDAAKSGDTGAGRCLIDRLVPPRKDRSVSLDLPALTSAADAPKVVGAIIAAAASGEVTPAEAADLTTLVDRYVRAAEVSDLEARVRALETKGTAP